MANLALQLVDGGLQVDVHFTAGAKGGQHEYGSHLKTKKLAGAHF